MALRSWLRADLEVPPLWFGLLVPPAVHARLVYGYDRRRILVDGEFATGGVGGSESGDRQAVRIGLYTLMFYFTCGLWISGLILAAFYHFVVFLGRAYYAAGGTALAFQMSILMLVYNVCFITVVHSLYKQKGSTSLSLIRLIGQVVFLVLCITTSMIPVDWQQSSTENRYRDLIVISVILTTFEYPAYIICNFFISQK
jgi:hypothetical protein